MAIYQVELDGKVIKTFEATSFFHNGEIILFNDQNNDTVGSIIAKPGMSVTKAGHDGSKQQGR